MMIFQLINENQANWFDNDLIATVENILKSVYEKKHIVIASQLLFDMIKENNNFSKQVRNAAVFSNQCRRELEALIKKNYVNSYIQIDLAKYNSFQVLEENEKTVLKSGYSFFMDSSAIQNTSLIGEDLNDTEFYIHIGKFYIRNHATLSQCALSYSSYHGGGNRTANVYKNILCQKKLCYCIVDSDKKHPSNNSPRGNTCKAFFNNANNFKEILFDQFGQVRILDVHEVESIIPIILLAKIFKNQKQENKLKTIQRLEKLIEKDSDIRKYFDHKKGLTKQQAQELDKKYNTYYITELNKLMGKNNKCFMHEDDEHINCDDNCFCLAPMGDELLSKSLEILEETTIEKNEIDKITLPYWETIGKDIFSWCCYFNVSMKVI